MGLLDQSGMQIYASKLIILFDQKYGSTITSDNSDTGCSLTYGLLSNLYQLFGKGKIALASREKALQLSTEETNSRVQLLTCNHLFQLEEFEAW